MFEYKVIKASVNSAQHEMSELDSSNSTRPL